MMDKKEYIAKTAQMVVASMTSVPVPITFEMVENAAWIAERLAKELEDRDVAPWPKSMFSKKEGSNG